MFRFDLEPLFQGEMRIVKHKSAYNLLILGLRGLQCETNRNISEFRLPSGIFGGNEHVVYL